MYGKIFQRMYQGSMVGAGGSVFAVWGYCIANADPETHCVDLNPVLLSTVIGDPIETIISAIEYLSKPDPNSHNKEQEGRRIVKTTGYEYFLVSHEEYRKMTNNEDLRAYFREQKRKQREEKKNVLDSLGQSQDPASASASVSVSAVERGTGGKPEKKIYGEMQKVKLTDEEYKKLIKVHGEADTIAAIEILDGYIASKGKRYQSHYATLKTGSWVWERVEEQKRKGQNAKGNWKYQDRDEDVVPIERATVTFRKGRSVSEGTNPKASDNVQS